MENNNYSWWKNSVVYQIYPRSFCDSNADGIGDIPGIISKLDYLHDLGIDIIWLSPIYASPNEDNGYDISDYLSIHPDFGTMDDFDVLIEESQKRNIRIIMDLVINHTSTEHYWFKQSEKGIDPYKDFYYWSDSWPGTPNNWTGFFGEKCWEWSSCRSASYLHLFAKHQADLNYHNPLVWEEIKKILIFWLEKGVAGFRCDVINILYKDSLESSRKKLILTGSEHYLSLPGTHKILNDLHNVLKPYNAFTVGETVFVDTNQACDLSAPERKELNMVFGFQHMEVDQIIVKWFRIPFHWERFIRTLDHWQREVPWNTIYFENHDQPRSISRFGSQYYTQESAKLLAVLLLTLQGTPFIFQGQEIGMRNFDFQSMSQVMDVESHNIDRLLKSLQIPTSIRWKIIKNGSRDHARTPMQWSSKCQAGFTAGTPWIALNGNHDIVNVETEQNQGDSILSFYKKLLAFRKNSSDLQTGNYQLLKSKRRLTVFARGNLVIYLNHSDIPTAFNCAEKIILSNYSTLPQKRLRPWEAIISERI